MSFLLNTQWSQLKYLYPDLISLRDTGLVGPEAGNDRVQELQRGPQLLEARGFEHELSGCDDNTEAPVPVHDDLRPPEHLDHQAQPHAVPLPVPVEAVHPQKTKVLFPP